MTPNLLILAGTTEATQLARTVADRNIKGTVSFAGRVDRPIRQPLPQRVGGFGGTAGLAAYIRAQAITHVIDATHPFAGQMSRNAILACAQAHIPLVALTRAPWQAQTGDQWTHVPDITAAVATLDRPAQRVMLAVGRMHLAEFAPNPHHFYLLRLVDPPKTPLPLPNTHVVVDRGPFTVENDQALMIKHGIDVVVSKNAGGSGAAAKITAARHLDLPVIMINRPPIPQRAEVYSIDAVFDWLDHTGTDRGV
ncbi:MAG: cobalt-precorrin-6A reductase [Pseudomonadota bacterium]